MSGAREPDCNASSKHDFFVLGTEDNGEEVARCGSCLTLRYTGKAGVRYVASQRVTDQRTVSFRTRK